MRTITTNINKEKIWLNTQRKLGKKRRAILLFTQVQFVVVVVIHLYSFLQCGFAFGFLLSNPP